MVVVCGGASHDGKGLRFSVIDIDLTWDVIEIFFPYYVNYADINNNNNNSKSLCHKMYAIQTHSLIDQLQEQFLD